MGTGLSHRACRAMPVASASAMLTRAIALLRAGDLVGAEKALAPLCAGPRPHADALHFQGVLRHRQGRTEDGMALVRRSLSLQPRNASAQNNLGNLLVEQGELAQAITCYQQAIACTDEPAQAADAWANLGALLRRGGDLPQAQQACERAIDARADHASAWYTLSQVLAERGDATASVQAYSRAVTLMPALQACRAKVLRALMVLGDRPQAAQLLRQWLAEEPGNAVAAHMLDACEGRTPARASDDYVSRMFDSYAATFDASLERLHYTAPQRVAEAVHARVGEPTGALRIADVGCGTGLMAPLLRPWASHLAGCDLSVGMLREARRRGGYDVLHQAELTHYLRSQPGAFDLVVSADTLCYFGDLREALQAAATALRPGGWLVFTVEALEGASDVDASLAQPFRLELSGRYAHTQTHLRAALAAAAFDAPQVTAVVPRLEGGREVAGWLASARRGDLPSAVSTRQAPDLKAAPVVRPLSGDRNE